MSKALKITIVGILFFIGLNGTCLALRNSSVKIENSKKEMVVHELKFNTQKPSLESVAKKFNSKKIPFQNIDCINWKEYPYKPDVKFRMAYSKQELYLQFSIQEKYIQAQCKIGNDSCWPSNDSCIEFFVSPESNDSFYNFEFSCIGYCLVQSGKPGPGRNRYPYEITKQIRTGSSLGKENFGLKKGDFEWTLTVAIPLSIMQLSDNKLKGKTWTANFYKCGDSLPEKAYLTWNPVETPNPNFHRPDFFGNLVFK